MCVTSVLGGNCDVSGDCNGVTVVTSGVKTSLVVLMTVDRFVPDVRVSVPACDWVTFGLDVDVAFEINDVSEDKEDGDDANVGNVFNIDEFSTADVFKKSTKTDMFACCKCDVVTEYWVVPLSVKDLPY